MNMTYRMKEYSMEFIEVSISTTTQGIDTLVSALEDIGVRGFAIEDSADFNEFLETVTPHWDYVDESLLKKREEPTRVKIYPEKNEQGQALIALLHTTLDELRRKDVSGNLGTLELSFSTVRDEDWANNYKKYFKPFPLGERLLIKPSWEETDNPENRVILEIDPSSSFGTGSHETTRLCLEQIETCVKPGSEVIDMGCGSGILSVAALLFGASHVTCVDIDEGCLGTTRENMERNGFGEECWDGYCGNVLTMPWLDKKVRAKQYDVVLANIVADVLIAMAPLFASILKKGGTLLCSGIIGPRAEEVRGALEGAGLRVLERREKNDWVLYKLTI